MTGKTREDYRLERPVTGRTRPENWSLHLSYLRGVDVRLHVYFPLLALLATYGSLKDFGQQGYLSQKGSHAITSMVATHSLNAPSLSDSGALSDSRALSDSSGTLADTLWTGIPWLELQPALLGMLVLLASVALHELGRLVVVNRLGGQFDTIVLTPVGGGTIPMLPGDPIVHLVTALFGPLVHLTLMVMAACGLVLAGQTQVIELLKPLAPNLHMGHLHADGSWLLLAAQLTVWLNWLLLLLNLLPVDPRDGAMLVRGLLWPVVGRASESVMTGRFATVMAFFMVGLAVAYRHAMVNTLSGTPVPAWLPLGVLAIVLAWGARDASGAGSVQARQTLDPIDRDESFLLMPQWPDEEPGRGEDRKAVLVERYQDMQQEKLERKRREQETNEDARVDAILARLHRCTLDELSDEERSILKRASRRYRQRRENA